METVLPVALQHLVVIILLFSSLFKADQKNPPKNQKPTNNLKQTKPPQTKKTQSQNNLHRLRYGNRQKRKNKSRLGSILCPLFQFCPLPLYIWGGSCLCACTTGYCLHHHSLLGDPFSSSLLSKSPALIGKWLIQCGGELMVSPHF